MIEMFEMFEMIDQVPAEVSDAVRNFFGPLDLSTWLRASVVVVVGFILGRTLHARLPVQRLHPQHQLMVRHSVKYIVFLLTIASALRILGVSLEIVLGTAGLLTVTLGFAAQTSASNIISGVFLMAERPFVIGDSIRVGEISGIVVSIDLVSVRLRSFDNLLVRITNETMLKSNVTNMSHHPIRRLDMAFCIAHNEDFARVRTLLLAIGDDNTMALEEPKPEVRHLGFGDHAVNLQFLVWTTTGNYLELRNQLYQTIQIKFRQEGIVIPIPQRAVHLRGDAPVLGQALSAAAGHGEDPSGSTPSWAAPGESFRP